MSVGSKGAAEEGAPVGQALRTSLWSGPAACLCAECCEMLSSALGEAEVWGLAVSCSFSCSFCTTGLIHFTLSVAGVKN